MSPCKVIAFVGIAFFLLITEAQQEVSEKKPPEDVQIVRSNFRFKQEEKALKIFGAVYDKHPLQNRCERYSKGFGETECIFFYEWVCIRYNPSSEGGDIYIPPKTKYFEIRVPADNVNYLLLSHKKPLFG